MQTLFQIYFQLGFEHILDPQGYDHIAFLVALCAIYRPSDWRKVALLATAFTIGHSLTLFLAAIEILPVNIKLTETLIPISILLTALYNVYQKPDSAEQAVRSNYGIALLFGLIHGMGFSNFFKAQTLPGETGNELIRKVLSFNLGVEAGQLIVVAFVLILTFVAFSVFHVRQYAWNLFISGIASGIAISLLLGS